MFCVHMLLWTRNVDDTKLGSGKLFVSLRGRHGITKTFYARLGLIFLKSNSLFITYTDVNNCVVPLLPVAIFGQVSKSLRVHTLSYKINLITISLIYYQ